MTLKAKELSLKALAKLPDLPPCKGAIAVNTIGAVGLITSDGPEPVVYSDGSESCAWVGYQLTSRTGVPTPFQEKPVTLSYGYRWTSRDPVVLGYLAPEPTLWERFKAWCHTSLIRLRTVPTVE